MDTTDPEIEFDHEGNCNHCKQAIERIGKQILPCEERKKAINEMIEKIKYYGKEKEYDCIIGVSGGVDSTVTAHYVKEYGLRPLAVHFDNGWNSELAVQNIQNIIEKLNIDLYTYVAEWDKFRDIQLAFLRSSLANCEAPTDHAITALLFREASKRKIKYILNGSNIATESILPYAWGHYNLDLRLMKYVNKKYGSGSIKGIPIISIPKLVYYVFVKGIKQIPLLNFIDYNKKREKEMIRDRYGWRDYGSKHYESVWTRFFQGYYLLKKFGYDKRRAHLSSLIVSKQISREEAIEELKSPTYDKKQIEDDYKYVIKKLKITEGEFERIISMPQKNATDYPSNYIYLHKMNAVKNIFRSIATRP